MIQRGWSITSRTGYCYRTAQQRKVEAIAILASMIAIGFLVCGTVLLSNML